jgi:hypothetical protein
MTSTSGPSRDQDPVAPPQPDGPDASELAARLRAPGELTAADVAALYRLDGGWPGPDDDPGYDPAYGNGPGCYDADPGSSPQGAELAADPDEAKAPEVLEAGFTHRYGGTGTGFAAGGPLDVMLPGPDLAWYTGQARQAGLSILSDDELIGALGAARRLASWQAELELAVVAELDARRADPGGREGEHVAEEIAAALTLTGRSAGSLLELSRRLENLPQTAALLAAGVIDRARAAVIADQLSLLDGDAAAAVEDRIAPRAGQLTTGQLAAACQRAVLAHDPQAAARRKDRAEKQARVECWAEPAGTGAIGGRDLNLAAVIAADKHLDAAARWLRRHGAAGTVDQLRARVFLARLTGQSLGCLLPAGHTPSGGMGRALPGGPGIDPNPDAPGSDPWPTGMTEPGGLTGLGGLTGSVNLVLPAAAWLGLTNAPGEIAGTGAADAATCRDLAAALAAHPATRWCLTVVDRNGRAVAHGCARAGPGPPGRTDPAAWLTKIAIGPIEIGTCAHRRESAAYQPPDSLRHLIKTRSPRCGYPGCRRPATRCDDDHTIPYHQGGKTCECNLYPLCRRHHGAKQALGWRLEQPEPGLLTWTLPSGRRYAVAQEPYPA